MAKQEQPAFYNDLDLTLAEAWHCLESGVTDRKSGFHTAQLATIAADGAPSVRTTVLRAVDRDAGWLQIHTDRRGPKPEEITREPRATLHFYNAAAKIQIRAAGVATVHGPDDIAEAAWGRTRPFSRECYRVNPAPGTPINHPEDAVIPKTEDAELGREAFAVVRLHVQRLEWLYLAAAGHRRARFDWRDGEMKATWLVP